MLYILNKPGEESIKQLAMVGSGDDEKALLLVTDAVFMATEANLKRFEGLDIDDFYAAKDAVEARVLEVSDDVEVVDYADMADLLADYDKVVIL